jgi:hypothetical protein
MMQSPFGVNASTTLPMVDTWVYAAAWQRLNIFPYKNIYKRNEPDMKQTKFSRRSATKSASAEPLAGCWRHLFRNCEPISLRETFQRVEADYCLLGFGLGFGFLPEPETPPSSGMRDVATGEP